MVPCCKLNFCRGQPGSSTLCERLNSADSSECPSLSVGLLQVDFGGSCVYGIAFLCICGIVFLAVNAPEFWLSLFSPMLLGPQLLLTLFLDVSAGNAHLNLNN